MVSFLFQLNSIQERSKAAILPPRHSYNAHLNLSMLPLMFLSGARHQLCKRYGSPRTAHSDCERLQGGSRKLFVARGSSTGLCGGLEKYYEGLEGDLERPHQQVCVAGPQRWAKRMGGLWGGRFPPTRMIHMVLAVLAVRFTWYLYLDKNVAPGSLQ